MCFIMEPVSAVSGYTHTFLSKYSSWCWQCSSFHLNKSCWGGGGGNDVNSYLSSFFTSDLICSLSFSVLFTSAFHHLFRPDDISSVKPPTPSNSGSRPVALQSDLKEEATSEGGGTLERAPTETISVLLWQQSYFWPCSDWQTVNLCVCVCFHSWGSLRSSASAFGGTGLTPDLELVLRVRGKETVRSQQVLLLHYSRTHISDVTWGIVSTSKAAQIFTLFYFIACVSIMVETFENRIWLDIYQAEPTYRASCGINLSLIKSGVPNMSIMIYQLIANVLWVDCMALK